jgi:hypothetical protein
LRENLAAQVRLYQEQLERLKGASVVNDDLTRQVKQADDTYRLYAQKQEESRISDELDKQKISNVSLLDFGCAIVAEFFRETVHTPAELEALTGFPVIATLPHNRKRPRLLNLRTLEQTEFADSPANEAEDDYVIEFINTKNQTAYSKY